MLSAGLCPPCFILTQYYSAHNTTDHKHISAQPLYKGPSSQSECNHTQHHTLTLPHLHVQQRHTSENGHHTSTTSLQHHIHSTRRNPPGPYHAQSSKVESATTQGRPSPQMVLNLNHHQYISDQLNFHTSHVHQIIQTGCQPHCHYFIGNLVKSQHKMISRLNCLMTPSTQLASSRWII